MVGNDLPQTVNQLLPNHTLATREQLWEHLGSCDICHEAYNSGPVPELPVKLPGCGHLFGSVCISKWIREENKNTCPICRSMILSRRVAQDSSTTASPITNSELIWPNRPVAQPTHFALRGEQLFRNLCEAIVCWIEDLDFIAGALDLVGAVKTWIWTRVIYLEVIRLGTFAAFMNTHLEEPRSYVAQLMVELPAFLPEPGVYDSLVEHMFEAHTRREELLRPDDQSLVQIAGWRRRVWDAYERILQIRSDSILRS